MKQIISWLLDKANHNKELCLFLHNAPYKFEDWVTTVAFYSALHLVKYKIFPVTIDNLRKDAFIDFEEYLSFIYEKKKSKATPHNLLKILVKQYLPEISPDYRFLLEQSKLSRYKVYPISKKNGINAIERLIMIEKHCIRK